MLPTKWNSDDRNAKQEPKYYMNKSGVQTSCEYPDDVAQKRKTTAAAACCNHFFTKRPQNQARDLKALQAKRNTNNGEAQDQSAKEIANCRKQSAKYQPD